MITYVNTVLVSNNSSLQVENAADVATLTSINAGDFIIQSLDNAEDQDDALTANTDKFRIGVALNGTTAHVDPTTGNVQNLRDIKWSNEIKKADIKSIRKLVCPENASDEDTPDTITIDFSKSDALTDLATGGKIVVLRLTFKDLPTRYRN